MTNFGVAIWRPRHDERVAARFRMRSSAQARSILLDNAGRFSERVTARNRCIAERLDFRMDVGFTIGPVVDALSDLFF